VKFNILYTYRDVIDVIVFFSHQEKSKFINVAKWGHVLFHNYFCGKFTTLNNQLSLLISCKLSVQIFGL
jgi:hypothetical protein